jgi:hypothetical protein
MMRPEVVVVGDHCARLNMACEAQGDCSHAHIDAPKQGQGGMHALLMEELQDAHGG